MKQQFALGLPTNAVKESANVEVIKSVTQFQQHQFVKTMHAAHVKRMMEVPVMGAQKEHVPDLQINVKAMENVNLVR